MDETQSLDSIAETCISSNNTEMWSKYFKEATDNLRNNIKSRKLDEDLKRTANGKISVSNFIWGDEGDSSDPHTEIQNAMKNLTAEEEEYKKENEEMFNSIQRNPNNPYLTKAERGILDADESGEPIDASRHEEELPEPNPYLQVQVGYDEGNGLVIKLGDATGCIAKEELPQLVEYINGIIECGAEGEEEEKDSEDEKEEEQKGDEKDSESDEEKKDEENGIEEKLNLDDMRKSYAKFAKELAGIL